MKSQLLKLKLIKAQNQKKYFLLTLKTNWKSCMTEIGSDWKNSERTTKGFVQLGLTEEQSSAVHILASYSADGILPGFCWLPSAFSYKFSFSSRRTVGQFHTCSNTCSLAAIQKQNRPGHFWPGRFTLQTIFILRRYPLLRLRKLLAWFRNSLILVFRTNNHIQVTTDTRTGWD